MKTARIPLLVLALALALGTGLVVGVHLHGPLAARSFTPAASAAGPRAASLPSRP